MKSICLIGFLFSLSCLHGQTFHEPVNIQADGIAISIDMGHLVPCVADWNNDGLNDLIVGQFADGKIRLYLNSGSSKEALFKNFDYIKAGGAEISLPSL
ncbi:hypothetical protein KAR48_10905 [bacterium]|nr:hypothetical protein [bacterium]